MLIIKHKWLVFFGGLIGCVGIFTSEASQPVLWMLGAFIVGIGVELHPAFFNRDESVDQ